MRWSVRSSRHRAQRGVSIIEAVVASGLLAIGVLAAMTALDTAQLGARQAVDQARANCEVRGKAEAILAGSYDANGSYGGMVDKQELYGRLQKLTVTATSGHASASLTFWKSAALSGPHEVATPGGCG
jgi:Tfp pilus assembly protein PilV